LASAYDRFFAESVFPDRGVDVTTARNWAAGLRDPGEAAPQDGMRGYADADGGARVGLADAMNVALAAAFQTADMFTTDGHFRMMRPLTGQPAFRLLPDDL
jgi:hypothetical protein